MRPRAHWLALLVTLSGLLLTPGTAWASCPASMLTVSPATAVAGQSVTVRGSHFMADCYDTGQPGRAPSSTRILISFSQGSSSIPLTRVDADADYSFTTVVRLPMSARPGAAALTARTGPDAATARLTIEPTSRRLAQTGGGDSALLAIAALTGALALRRRSALRP